MSTNLQLCSNSSNMRSTSNRLVKRGLLSGPRAVRIRVGFLMNRTNGYPSWVLRFAEAGLSGDPQKMQSVITTAIKNLRKESPEVSKALADLIAQLMANPNSLAWSSAGPPPADAEEGMALVRMFKTD